MPTPTPSTTPLLYPPLLPHSPPSLRHRARTLLASDAKHYLVMFLVAVDVGAALLDILLTLAACDLHGHLPRSHEAWSRGLHAISLAFGWVFLGELGVCLWAFGAGFFKDWFHCFDALVIVGSLVVDGLGEGVVVEDLGGLVIGLRLWRVGKIVEELSVGVREREEEREGRVRALERECEGLRRRVEVLRGRRGYGGS
ncbi:hypothetical protein QBC39DRAFT_385280 [Podospora conica]|nr:hypothetical protein QBC39DRAFT_385280 [Schizothecium conicum]